MRVLVTGGRGYLGRHVCRQLSANGHDVLALDVHRADPGVPWAQQTGSILDPAALTEAARNQDAIIHCAALTGLWAKSAATHREINLEGTRRVVEAAKTINARLVHVSSYTTLISGPRTPARTLDERVEVPAEDLLGPYPRSKREAELLVIAAARSGLEASIVLPSSPVGAGDRNLTPPSRMIRDLARGALPAYLDCMMNLIDIRSVADGIVKALQKGQAGRRYLLSGEDVRLGSFAQMIAARTGQPAPKRKVPYGLALSVGMIEACVSQMSGRPPNAPLTGVRLAGRNVCFSNTRARQELGFDPGSLASALDTALDWMADDGLIPELAPA